MRTILVALIMVVSLFLIQVPITKANPDVYASMPSFKIDAPQNTTYPSNPMVFKVEAGMVKGEYTGETKPTLFCLIDNKPITIKAQIKSETPSYIRFSGETSLNLTIGNHTFSVQDISCSGIGTMYHPSVQFSLTSSDYKQPYEIATIAIIGCAIAMAVVLILVVRRVSK
jgi:hypothetical protein